MCVRARARGELAGAGVGPGRDGIKSSGSNIMIHFLYILLLEIHMAHVLVLSVIVILLVVTVICIMFVKLRKWWRML